MAFQNIEKSKHFGRNSSSVFVGLRKNAKQRVTQISLHSEIAAAIGLAKGDHVALAAGTGEDDGWLRVSKSDKGFKLGRDGGNSKRLKFSSANVLRNLSSFPQIDCKHHVVGNALLIEIPARLRVPTISVAA